MAEGLKATLRTLSCMLRGHSLQLGVVQGDQTFLRRSGCLLPELRLLFSRQGPEPLGSKSTFQSSAQGSSSCVASRAQPLLTFAQAVFDPLGNITLVTDDEDRLIILSFLFDFSFFLRRFVVSRFSLWTIIFLW